MNAEERFQRDIPDNLRDDVKQRISEALWDQDDSKRLGVTILEIDQLDVCNHRMHGIIKVKDDEYTFVVEIGNWAGFVFESWNEDVAFELHKPVVYALRPDNSLVSSAIINGNGPFLVLKWDALLQRDKIASIPGNYSYDQHFQPGSYTRDYWQSKAREHRFEIVTEEEAQETRKRLMNADKPTPEVLHAF